MANQEVVRLTLLRNIRAFSLTFKIRVRVSRIWRPRRFNSVTYDGLHYLLIDETGDTIHAKIDESDYPHVSNKMQQGEIYDISVFYTRNDPSRHKIANHDVQLFFNESTKFELVEGIVPPIPEYSFRLLDFNDLPEQARHQPLLIDLYGCIKSATPVFEVPIKDTDRMESKLELTLENLRREDLRITLWGDAARKFSLESVDASGSAILALFTSLRVTKFRLYHCFLHSGWFVGFHVAVFACSTKREREIKKDRESQTGQEGKNESVQVCFFAFRREREELFRIERVQGERFGLEAKKTTNLCIIAGVAALVFGFKKLPEVGWRAKRVSSLNGTVNLSPVSF